MCAVCTSTLARLSPCSGIGQVVVDFAVGHHDAAFHFAVAQPRQHDFVADLLAELGPQDAVPFQRGAEVLQGKLVALGDAAQGRVEFDVGYAQAGVAGELQLHAVGDHAFEQLAVRGCRPAATARSGCATGVRRWPSAPATRTR
jgi:hypothetical protein